MREAPGAIVPSAFTWPGVRVPLHGRQSLGSGARSVTLACDSFTNVIEMASSRPKSSQVHAGNVGAAAAAWRAAVSAVDVAPDPPQPATRPVADAVSARAMSRAGVERMGTSLGRGTSRATVANPRRNPDALGADFTGSASVSLRSLVFLIHVKMLTGYELALEKFTTTRSLATHVPLQ